jgi:hypothetical protein
MAFLTRERQKEIINEQQNSKDHLKLSKSCLAIPVPGAEQQSFATYSFLIFQSMSDRLPLLLLAGLSN